MWETYLLAFKALVNADVETIMCAYNSTNGEPCCANKYLLQDVLREKWNFDGHIVSDCWAQMDFYQGHNVVETPEEAAALGIKSGVNLNCGSTYPALSEAVKQGLVIEAEIDEQLKVLLKTKFKLGLFDPIEGNPYSTATVTNTGDKQAEEVVQLYVSDLETSVDAPKYQLHGIKRILLEPGASEEIQFEITPGMMELVNADGERVLEKGEFKIYIGGSTPHERNVELGMAKVKEATSRLK